jgi:AraC-like DNA-binding protein
MVAQDDDDLVLFINSGGVFAASQCGRETEIPVGGAYLMSCAEAGAYRWPAGMKLTVVRARREAISSLVRNVYDNIGRGIAPGNEGLCLLTRYLHILHDAEPFVSSEARALVTRHVQDLLALALGATGDARELAGVRSVRAVRLHAIKVYIERLLDRPELSPEIVARHFRISPRTVQRLFGFEGTTFSEFVLERRLARAHAVLGDLRGERRGVADIALDCGFGNISYFNRRFRARYGATPSGIRKRHLQ